jgi:hypothetical protein
MAARVLIKEKISNWSERPLTFNAACCFSIVVHVGLFLSAALVLHFFETVNFYSPPLIFDYVFSPEQEVGQALESLEVEAEPEAPSPASKTRQLEPKLTARAANPKDSNRQPPNENRSAEETAPVYAAADGIIEEDALDETTAAGADPDEAAAREPESPFYVEAILPKRPSVERLDSQPRDDVPAKIFMSDKQQKMLAKKIKRWSERLDPKKWLESNFEWRHDGKTYSARLQRLPAASSTALDEAVIEISTEENGYAMATEMRLRRLAFSNFAQFVDYWDPNVAVHNDELNGRFHANTTINVSSSRGVQPKFHGKVTTASYDVRMGGPFPVFDQKSIFIGGLETGVKEIHLPKTNLPFLSDSAISENQWHRLTEETWLHFRGDGAYSWRSKSAEKEQKRLLPNMPFYIVGEKDARLHVKGVLRGQVLIYTVNRIIIDDDLIYSRHPEAASDADDFLGLVSEGDIEIAHPDVTGPGDLHLHASIYAKGRFRVRHLQGKNDATLYIYGSLTAGSISATEPRYATHITFDKRLESRRPPNFPMSDRYELKDWDGAWRLKPRGKVE